VHSVRSSETGRDPQCNAVSLGKGRENRKVHCYICVRMVVLATMSYCIITGCKRERERERERETTQQKRRRICIRLQQGTFKELYVMFDDKTQQHMQQDDARRSAG